MDHIDRMKAEYEELDGRLNDLSVFLHTNTFNGLSEESQWLLVEQHKCMKRYRNILNLRLIEALNR